MGVVAAVVGAVAGGVASAVGAVAGAVAATIGTAVTGISAAVGGIVSALGGTIGGLVSGIGGAISAIGQGTIKPIADGVSGIGSKIADTVKGITTGLSSAIAKIKAGITKPLEPILLPIKDTLVAVKTTVEAIKAPVEAIIKPVQQVRETIQSIANLKILRQVLDGTGSISELLGDVADDKSESTAAAIAELTKSIATTTIGLMDKVDQEYKLTKATLDNFEATFTQTVNQRIEQAKAYVLSMVTPKIDLLGRHQLNLNRAIARVTRRIDDPVWFGYMLLRFLK